MFIGNRYYNEDNISTVDFEVITEMQSFDVYSKKNIEEMKDQLWVHNLSINQFNLFQEPDKWSGGRKWTIISQEEVDRSKESYESKRIRWDKMNEDERDEAHRWNMSERDVKEAKQKYTRKTSNFALQKDLLSRKKEFSYVFEEGYIEAKIIMNNGNEFKEPLQYWCHKQGIEEGKLKTFEKTDRVYLDKEVTIEYVHSILGKSKHKIDKEYI